MILNNMYSDFVQYSKDANTMREEADESRNVELAKDINWQSVQY